MAIRLQAEFRSDQGDQYKIEIHDTDWLGGIHEFNVGSNGFELTYRGQTDDIVSPIVGSQLSIAAYSNDGQFTSFINSLKEHQEDRFRIVVYRSESHTRRAVGDGLVFEPLLDEEDETTYQFWWCGWIIQDVVTLEDVSQPFIYNIVANDGIGRLSNIDYTTTNNITQNGFGLTRSTDLVINILSDAGLSDLFDSSDVFLESSVDWWETAAHIYTTSTDPFYLTGLDVTVFHSFDEEGNTIYLSCFEILRQIATLYNARIYFERGRYVFEQIGNRTSTTRSVSQYSKSGTKIQTIESVNDDITLDQTAYGARLAGNQWNFLPALKKVSINYRQKFLSPWLAAYGFNSSQTTYDIGFIAGGQGIQLALYGPVRYSITSSTGSTSNDIFALAPVFRAQIRIEDSSNPGTFYYYNRSFSGYGSGATFGTAGWSTTSGYYYFDLEAQGVGSGVALMYLLTTITTTDVPVTGAMRLVVELYNPYNVQNNTVYTLAAHQTESWSVVFVVSRVDDGQEPADGVVYASNNSSSDVNSNLTLDLGDINIADGALQTGDLIVYKIIGGIWQASSSWRKGSSGTGVSILSLLTTETLALHSKPVERYEGKMYLSSPFGRRVVFDSNYYLRIGGVYSANNDEWDAEYFLINRDTSNISAINELPADRTPALGRSGGSTPTGGPNELTAGKVGGMKLDAVNLKMGPFQQVATGGKVNGTLQATGAATMSSTLSVTGNSTFAADADFEGSHTALIQDVEHSNGSEYDVRDEDFIVFNSWVGGNGEAFVNLPEVSASEGRMIRFKSDSTIGANTYVTLRPNAGDTSATIDGETSATFNRSYDGIMVLCHSNQWFIVQRKSK